MRDVLNLGGRGHVQLASVRGHVSRGLMPEPASKLWEKVRELPSSTGKGHDVGRTGRGTKSPRSTRPAHGSPADHCEDGVYPARRARPSQQLCSGPDASEPAPPTSKEEGVVLVTCWVLLGLEKGIKVPEGALNEVVGRHLREPGGR